MTLWSVSAPASSEQAFATSADPDGTVSVTGFPTSAAPGRLALTTVKLMLPEPFEPFSATR